MLRKPIRALVYLLVVTGMLGASGCSPDTFSPDLDSVSFCSVVPFLCENEDYQPEQPIFYSHKIHAGDNQIPCQYCHSGARRGDHAVIPSVERCMGCHTFINAVSEDVKKYQGEIDKLRDFHAKGEPIPWVKVHDLPDHVRFSHKPHVQNGLACQTCHGAVETFDTGIKPGWDENLSQAPLTMGWCVQCHRENTPRVAEENLRKRGLAPESAEWPEAFKDEKKLVFGNLMNCYTCHK